MQEWSDSVKIAIDVIIACVIISALLVCMTLGRKMMRVVDNDRAAAQTVKEYRIEAAYANTIVHPQDVVNRIIESQGYPAVEVVLTDGTRLNWNTTSYSTALTSADIGGAVGWAKDFRCTLTYATDGGLSKYTFTQQ